MGLNNKYKKYMVVEKYFGNKIVVDVSEYWSKDGIESVDIICDYNSSIRGLGHKSKNLSIDDVNDAILKEFEIAEKRISYDLEIEHDGFHYMRNFDVVVEYQGQKIVVLLTFNSCSDKVGIACPYSGSFNWVKMADNEFRNKIIEVVEKNKELVDNECVFSKSGTFNKVKKKIKDYFNY